jgi:hypothetical protein
MKCHEIFMFHAVMWHSQVIIASNYRKVQNVQIYNQQQQHKHKIDGMRTIKEV